ncbi:MAG: PAS domain S-box protein [Spirochaetes bacterium]|nr:PAS domain S-box protein [Spirochaetota bacterium]MBN2770696.1 PAS domain S-box protein [Spirochaetota bacterium]
MLRIKSNRNLFFTIVSAPLFITILILAVLTAINPRDRQNPTDCDIITRNIAKSLYAFEGNPAETLSESNILQPYLFTNRDEYLEELDTHLEGVKNSLKADIVYIMDTNGLVIASSSAVGSDPLTGNNYGFRPYFRKALRGEAAIYPGLGVTTDQRGIYYSAPLRERGGKIIAVIVIKVNVNRLEKELYKYDDPTFIITKEQVIFASNRPELLYHYILPIDESTLENIYRSNQFASTELRPFIHITNDATITFKNRDYYAQMVPLKNTGWKLIKLNSDRSLTNSKYSNKIYAITLSSLLFILALIYYIALYRFSAREKELNADIKLYKNLFSLGPDAVCVTDIEGSILSHNEAFSQLFGYEPKTIESMNIRDFYADPETDRPRLLYRLDLKKSLRNYILVMKTKDGKLLRTSNSLIRIDHKGNQVIESVIRDISEAEIEKRQLRTAQKREMIGIMSSGLAHDFNNILAAINASASLIRYSTNNDQSGGIEEIVLTIENAVEKGSTLVKRISSLARHEEGKYSLIDLARLLNEIHDIFRKTVPSNIKTTICLNTDRSRIKGDPVQIEQVILNILINASHSMSIMKQDQLNKGGTITTTLETVEKNDLISFFPTCDNDFYICISISDTGVGIPSDLQERVFEPFFTTKDKTKGSGLGLSMVFDIIKQHGGLIRFESEENRGTTFFIYFPYANIE